MAVQSSGTGVPLSVQSSQLEISGTALRKGPPGESRRSDPTVLDPVQTCLRPGPRTSEPVSVMKIVEIL